MYWILTAVLAIGALVLGLWVRARAPVPPGPTPAGTFTFDGRGPGLDVGTFDARK